MTPLGIKLQIHQDEQTATNKDARAKVSCVLASLSFGPRSATAYSAFAQHLDAAAAAWDNAAGEWGTANKPAASTDEKNAAGAWQTAAADWTKAGNSANYAADTANRAATWDQPVAWDAAAWD